MELDDRIRAALDRAVDEVRAAAQAEVDEVRQSADQSVRALHDSAVRLSDTIKAIDSASTLGAVLNIVSGCARLETGRASLAIVRDGHLLNYPSRAIVPSETADALLTAVQQRIPVVEENVAVFPIVLGGQVAVVLSTAAPSSPQALATLELLTRHAGRVLETMTIGRITGLAPLPPRALGASIGIAP